MCPLLYTNTNNEILISKNLYENYNILLGDELELYNNRFKIIGVIDNDSGIKDYSVYFNEKLGIKNNILISRLSIKFINDDSKNLKELNNIVISLNENFYSELESYTLMNMDEIYNSIYKVYDIIIAVIASIVGISIVISCICVMNIMFFLVNDRKLKIGIKMALGATQNNIIIQFLIDAIILIESGFLIGLFMSMLTQFIYNLVTNSSISTSLHNIFIVQSIIFILTILVNIIPIYIASITKISDLLNEN